MKREREREESELGNRWRLVEKKRKIRKGTMEVEKETREEGGKKDPRNEGGEGKGWSMEEI